MDRLRVVVTGVAGRMGAALVQQVKASDGLVLSGATARPGSPAVGQDAGLVAGAGALGVTVSDALAPLLANADVVVDFTHPEPTLAHAHACAEAGVPIVIGTTGLSPEQKAEIAELARRIPIVMAPNMSVGVNVLFKIAGEVARVLGDAYDVEIFESHHRMKKDAPSGTAIGLIESVAGALGLDPQQDVIHDRHGFIGERPARKIGVQVARGGDVVGEHTVMFLGQGERVELTHRATNRGNFATGALRAAKWVKGREPGLHSMLDVLGLA